MVAIPADATETIGAATVVIPVAVTEITGAAETVTVVAVTLVITITEAAMVVAAIHATPAEVTAAPLQMQHKCSAY